MYREDAVSNLGDRLRASVRGRSKRHWLLVGLAVLLVVGLGAGGVVATRALRAAPPFVPVLPRLALAPLATDAPTPTTAGLSEALSKPASVPELGTLTGVVIDPTTGRQLWSQDADQPLAPGSANKVLTSAAVLMAVDPTKRLVTKVLAGPTPDSVVLVGGGDPTISVLPAGSESVYRGAAKLSTLAEMVQLAHPAPIKRVYVNDSLFAGPDMAPGWDKSDIEGGNFTPIGALIADGGRTDPAKVDPPRTPTPATDAGRAFAQFLGADPNSVAVGSAPPGAAVLGRVESPPISDLVEIALTISDNVLAESLARQVALAKGDEPSFAGGVTAVRSVLSSAGFDLTGMNTVDGSGLSTEDRVPARLLGQVMSVAAGPDSDPRADRLRSLLWGLPVAGGTGTLDNRFGDADSLVGRGWVRAKTGTLTGVNALAGVVTDTDGRLLAFALMSNGTSPAASRPKLDNIAAALRDCGCR
jgi:D-alanyl-D-alanine carboxypeptidase/D-alanyl-D-alanine-endopeptidase (penicillin-binding protein 4)